MHIKWSSELIVLVLIFEFTESANIFMNYLHILRYLMMYFHILELTFYFGCMLLVPCVVKYYGQLGRNEKKKKIKCRTYYVETDS